MKKERIPALIHWKEELEEGNDPAIYGYIGDLDIFHIYPGKEAAMYSQDHVILEFNRFIKNYYPSVDEAKKHAETPTRDLYPLLTRRKNKVFWKHLPHNCCTVERRTITSPCMFPLKKTNKRRNKKRIKKLLNKGGK